MKKVLLFIFIFVLSFTFLGFSVKANEEETQEPPVEDNTTEEEKLTFEEEQIKNAILELLGDEEKKGFIEKNLDVLLASFGGTVVALAVLLYFVIRALNKTKDLVDKFKKQGKVSDDQSQQLNELIDFCKELIEICKKEMEQSLLNAGATEQHIKEFEEKVENVIHTVENKEDQIAEILKIAFINDTALIKKGVSEVIKEKYKDYDQKTKN